MDKKTDTRLGIKNIKKFAQEGILTSNPLFMQVLGMCPALATTTSAVNGLGMGLSTGLVLTFSNLLISLLRKLIPKQVRLASYIVIISVFVTALEMLLKAYIPALDRSLGVFIPLIVVNCIIFARAESYASKNGPLSSMLDGAFMGLGFAFALFLLGSIREIIGTGSFAGIQIFNSDYAIMMIASPSGAFFSLGILIAAFKSIMLMIDKKNKQKEEKEEAGE
jgi:electron transport complex protein RnfE